MSPATYTVKVLTKAPLDVVLAPGSPTSYVGAGRVIDDSDGTPHIDLWSAAVDATIVHRVVDASRECSEPCGCRIEWSRPHEIRNGLRFRAICPARVATLAASLVADSTSRLDAVNSVEELPSVEREVQPELAAAEARRRRS